MIKKTVTLAALLLLAACGFHPVYGVNKYTATGAEEYLQHITIGNIPDREGQFLRNELIDRFYRDGRANSAQAIYGLNVENLYESTTKIDITKDADATRGQLKTSARMNLIDTRTGQIILTRDLVSIASYNILESEFTNRVSEQNARENTLRDIAAQIERHLALYFKRQS